MLSTIITSALHLCINYIQRHTAFTSDYIRLVSQLGVNSDPASFNDVLISFHNRVVCVVGVSVYGAFERLNVV